MKINIVLFKKRVFPQTNNVWHDLAEIRKKYGISLETISRRTKVPVKYLRALEGGSVKMLPDVLYTKYIIKKYLAIFNIDPRPFIAGLAMERTEKLSPQKALRLKSLIVLPRIIKAVLVISIILAILSYLVFGINKIFISPAIVVLSPADQEIVADSVIAVRGKTEKDAEIFINNEQAILDRDGNFSKEVNLQKGLNSIKISGVKRYSKETIIWRNVILEIKQ